MHLISIQHCNKVLVGCVSVHFLQQNSRIPKVEISEKMSSKAHGFKRKDLDANSVVPLKELGTIGKENERLKPCDHGRDHQSTAKKLESSPPLMAACELDEAATRVQKVYKSYRTRRNLADCAVVAEELWWKALDFAALNRSSVSFFNTNEQESAASRWDRATRRVAKVGKGLLKDEKAQKLALHHWLEAIDPRHRYGRNLRFYYDEWFVKKSYQPFFYWLDIGDGKELNLPSCPRVDLQRQCIQYLGPKERGAYEVIVEGGKLVFKKNKMLLNTDEGTKWIFVLSTSRSLYIGPKKKGRFQHSSFLSGGVATSAGRLVARDGILEAIWPYSGHYLPTEDNFTEFISFLEKNNIDLTDVKRCSNDDDDLSYIKVDVDEYRLDITTTASTATIMIEDDIEPLGPIIVALDDKISIDASSINATRLYLTRTISNKWASGVGPRIGCLRDYPMELRSQALEKVNLPPTLNPLSSYLKCDSPIPAPRPVPKVRVSPRLACMVIPIPSVSPSAWIAS